MNTSLKSMNQSIGRRLRKRRIQLEISQKKVGKALGISFQAVQRYENGKNSISASKLYLVSRLLNVPVDYFYKEINEDT